MSRPVNIWCPCDGDVYDPQIDDGSGGRCDGCNNYEVHGGKCLGNDGWAFMALANAEVTQAATDAIAQEWGNDA